MTVKINGNAVVAAIVGAGMAAAAYLGFRHDKETKQKFLDHKAEVLNQNDIYRKEAEIESDCKPLNIEDRIKLAEVLTEYTSKITKATTISSIDMAIGSWSRLVDKLSAGTKEDKLVIIRYEHNKLEEAKKRSEAAAERVAEKAKYDELANSIRSLGYSIGNSQEGVSISLGR